MTSTENIFGQPSGKSVTPLPKFFQTACKVHRSYPFQPEMQGLLMDMIINTDLQLTEKEFECIGLTREDLLEHQKKPYYLAKQALQDGELAQAYCHTLAHQPVGDSREWLLLGQIYQALGDTKKSIISF